MDKFQGIIDGIDYNYELWMIIFIFEGFSVIKINIIVFFAWLLNI
jgi:hypothetical protein